MKWTRAWSSLGELLLEPLHRGNVLGNLLADLHRLRDRFGARLGLRQHGGVQISEQAPDRRLHPRKGVTRLLHPSQNLQLRW